MNGETPANDGVMMLALRAFAHPRPPYSPVATALLELHRLAVPVDTTLLLDLLLARRYVAYNEANELTITPSGRSVLACVTLGAHLDSQPTR